MIAEAGLAAIWLAASMALLQFIAGLTLLRSGAGQLAPLIKPAAYMQGALCTFAFFALMWLFYISDLSVLLVANNSHIDKPLIFKLAGTWGNHEGSMLLWVTILAVSGAAIAFLEKRIEAKTLSATLAVQGFLALGFFAFLLFSSNPFERMVPAPIEGAGLNPCFRTLASRFTRQHYILAMLAFRLHSPSPLARCSPIRSGQPSPALCGHGCWGHGFS